MQKPSAVRHESAGEKRWGAYSFNVTGCALSLPRGQRHLDFALDFDFLQMDCLVIRLLNVENINRVLLDLVFHKEVTVAQKFEQHIQACPLGNIPEELCFPRGTLVFALHNNNIRAPEHFDVNHLVDPERGNGNVGEVVLLEIEQVHLVYLH